MEPKRPTHGLNLYRVLAVLQHALIGILGHCPTCHHPTHNHPPSIKDHDQALIYARPIAFVVAGRAAGSGYATYKG